MIEGAVNLFVSKLRKKRGVFVGGSYLLYEKGWVPFDVLNDIDLFASESMAEWLHGFFIEQGFKNEFTFYTNQFVCFDLHKGRAECKDAYSLIKYKAERGKTKDWKVIKMIAESQLSE